MRSAGRTVCAIGFLLLLGAPVLAQRSSENKLLAQWIVSRMRQMFSMPKPAGNPPDFSWQNSFWGVIGLLQPLDDASKVAVVKEAWPLVKEETARQILLTGMVNFGIVSGAPPNPHLLEFLDLGIADTSINVRTAALSLAQGLAFQEFRDADAYRAWRQQNQEFSLEKIVQNHVQPLVQRIRQGKPEERSAALNRLSLVGFGQDTGYSIINGEMLPRLEGGLRAIQRKALLEANLLDALALCLKPEAALSDTKPALILLGGFDLSDEYRQRIEADVRRSVENLLDKKEEMPGQILRLLTRFSSDWTIPAINRYIKQDTRAQQGHWEILNALRFFRDPRIIPTLIGVLDILQPWEMYQVHQNLQELTLVTPGQPGQPQQEVASDWWRDWWDENRAGFPKEVARQDIPELGAAKSARRGIGRINEDGSFSILSARKRLRVDNDPRRTFFLISNGRLYPAGKEKFTEANLQTALPVAERPGLLVLLYGKGRDLNGLKDNWQNILNMMPNGNYVVAIAMPPVENAETLWPTHANAADPGLPRTEAFVRDIVRTVQTQVPLNPSRIFLRGEGEGATAVYACSLDAQTPFRGFSVFAGDFRMGQLPPLAPAKGRRYFIQYNPDDKELPFFRAVSARDSLTKAGAQVKLAPYQPQPPQQSRQATPAQIQEAMQWLEGG